VRADTDVGFTVDRAQLLAALDTAAVTTNPTPRRHRVQIRPHTRNGLADVAVRANSGEAMYRTAIRLGDYAGPACTLTFDPTLVRQAVAFLPGPVAAIADGLAVCLGCGDRHAILMQIAVG
jgi:hypothetical protein